MKQWFVAAIVTGIVMLPAVTKKKKEDPKPISMPSETDKRYDIEEFVSSEAL
jgi:hypothetical protein